MYRLAPAPETASIAAGAIAALGASTCCVLPLLLASVGIGGAWVAQLGELGRFQFVFIGLAVGAFGYAFYRLYLRPVGCAPDDACASARVRRNQRIVFWVTLILATLLLLFPYYAPLLPG